VDTSGSMATNGLYPRVKSVLRTFLKGLRPTDHVEVYTFAEAVSPCLAPKRGRPDAIVDCLPGDATGAQTDIGLAIDAALHGLERDDAAAVGAVVLLTDGEHRPGPGSAYTTNTNDAAWTALATRARALATRHHIEGYAINLGGATGATVLRRAVSTTTVLDPTSVGQLNEYLDRAKAGVRRAKAREALAGDIGKGVRASWTVAPGGRVPAAVTLTLTSQASRLPLTVTGLRVSAPDGVVVTGDLPRTVDLAPGESRSFRLSATWTPRAGRVPFYGERTVTGVLTAHGSVASVWASALAGAVDLATPVDPADAARDVDLTAVAGTIWAQVGVGVVALTLVALAWLAWFLLTHAAQSGTIIAVDATTGYDVAKFPLNGRRARLRGQGLPGSARVSARRVKQSYDNAEGRRYTISYRVDDTSNRRSFPAGGSALIGRIAFEHVPAALPIGASNPARP